MTHECIIKQEEEFALQQTPKSLLLFKRPDLQNLDPSDEWYPRLANSMNLEIHEYPSYPQIKII